MNTYYMPKLSELLGLNDIPIEIDNSNKSFSFCYSGELNPFYGKKHTEDSLKKMRKPKSTTENMGKYIRTEQTKQKLSESNKGKGHPHSEETKIKLRKPKTNTEKMGWKKGREKPKHVCPECGNNKYDILNYIRHHKNKCLGNV